MRAIYRKTWTIVLAAAAAGLAWPGGALAWGPDGHEYIATVARDRLAARDPKLGGRFYALLKGNILHYVGKDKRTGQPATCEARNLREIASWADCVRYTTAYAGTAGYHFDDIGMCDDVAPAPPPLPAYCADGKCASEGLAHYIAILKDKKGSRRTRAEALAWVIHIVGDLHQPLHNETNNDHGGNLVTITLAPNAIPGRTFSAANLHALWDTPMVFASVGSGAAAVATIRALADQHSADWAQNDVRTWVVEAHAIAKPAYHALPNAPACNAGAAAGGQITSAYVDPFKDQVREQLASAAIRLTDILADALA